MTNIKILEWNINQRSCENSSFPEYVITEISRKNPDVIVLVEFKGENNRSRLDRAFSERYYTYSYNGSQYTSVNGNIKTGNGIYMGLKKSIFSEPSPEEITWEESFKDKQTKRQIIIGDLNYGLAETDWCEKEKLNWQDIVYMMRVEGYLDYQQFSPYSPPGTSWKGKQLDWLITKGVFIDGHSHYNQLDWSFGKNKDLLYLEGYRVPEGFFIINEPPFPDHAILTTEITLE
ncbi:endonuclease/exonuclease/phosphatase family protein [Streptococcus parasuis]|uniref:endonuclease/exonuclease/phosphatase family protein n=2 Tax=Streptococcus parasuis TaxID=1501662 RepID=UPI0028B23242|nr:endonuclease/exonuclease/phosphatase family protein [Streptococcus parasuis]